MQKSIKISQKILILKSFKDFSKSISIRKFAFGKGNLLEKETEFNKKWHTEFNFIKQNLKFLMKFFL
jgi:hypothetical protein